MTDLLPIIALSLRVSITALALGAAMGVPLGAWLGLSQFRGRGLLVALIYTGMGLPPVVVGLFVYLMLSRAGPLGAWQWLFTPNAMIAAQTILAMPLIAGFVMAAVMGVDPDLRRQFISLGATSTQATLAVLREARTGVVVALVAGFGGVISEVGAVMLVGGNIAGETRTLTTAIVLETRQGDFDRAIALGLVLLAISFAINLVVMLLQGRAGVVKS
ncbi:MAG TPA: ABC transporter permease [Thermoflexales bacterium]|nr:ABC transporter permease [Thermoflexales bacterium]HQW35726.1 ABC transporter permease [Thermoflexales bacterium]HQZ22615.1 ABC transporter permease [Thermoflexales bacterium]HQZ98928.1 ABC transporter permease [Thermoflexales bacterium]